MNNNFIWFYLERLIKIKIFVKCPKSLAEFLENLLPRWSGFSFFAFVSVNLVCSFVQGAFVISIVFLAASPGILLSARSLSFTNHEESIFSLDFSFVDKVIRHDFNKFSIMQFAFNVIVQIVKWNKFLHKKLLLERKSVRKEPSVGGNVMNHIRYPIFNITSYAWILSNTFSFQWDIFIQLKIISIETNRWMNTVYVYCIPCSTSFSNTFT